MSDAAPIGIYGSGGCGRGIMPLARAQFPDRRLVFVDDFPTGGNCNGHQLLTLEAFLDEGGAEIAVAIAEPRIRRQVVKRCQSAGLGFVGIAAADVVVMDDVAWGSGCLFSPRVTLTSNIRIGSHFHCNLLSYVEHDCRIGDFVTFAPGVQCNGAVTIGDLAYIGAGAIIRQGISIGREAVVGMGAIVVRDVPDGVTVAGNPARLLLR